MRRFVFVLFVSLTGCTSHWVQPGVVVLPVARTAMAESVEVLPEPVKVAAADSLNTYTVPGGTYSVLGVELGLFLQSDLQKQLKSQIVTPVPPATVKIDNIVSYDIPLSIDFIPRDGKSYRLGLRYHTNFTPTPLATTPSRTPPDSNITCQGLVWSLSGTVFVRNGANTQGRGTKLICTGNNVYGFGMDGVWWKFVGPIGSSTEWMSTYSGQEPSTLITFPPESRLSVWAYASRSTVHSGTNYNLTPAGPAVPLLSGAPKSGSGWVTK